MPRIHVPRKGASLLKQPVLHAKQFDGLTFSLPTRAKRPSSELELDVSRLSKKIRLSECADEKNATVKTFSPAHDASPVRINIAQAGAADLPAILGGASGVVPAAKSDRAAEFDDSVLIIDEYTLYNEVKHGDKNSARLFLCDLEADEFGEFEGGDDESDDDGETFSEFEGDGEYDEEYDE